MRVQSRGWWQSEGAPRQNVPAKLGVRQTKNVATSTSTLQQQGFVLMSLAHAPRRARFVIPAEGWRRRWTARWRGRRRRESERRTHRASTSRTTYHLVVNRMCSRFRCTRDGPPRTSQVRSINQPSATELAAGAHPPPRAAPHARASPQTAARKASTYEYTHGMGTQVH